MKQVHQRKRRRVFEAAWIGVLGLAGIGVGVAVAVDPVPSTLNDFFLRGSQPGMLIDPLAQAIGDCQACHSQPGVSSPPFDRWAGSMKAQAGRDPIFHACMTIANQDVPFAGESCLRCHAPAAWMEGRSDPPDGSALIPETIDFEGVNCSICHRMVDPDPNATYPGGATRPARDAEILNSLNVGINGVPVNPGNANFVLDPLDVRRGPLDLEADWNGFFPFHAWAQSPFHKTARQCATCHDISNPLYDRHPDGTYRLNTMNEPHPTQNKYDMFPIERTFSEWAVSMFAQGPVDLGSFTDSEGVTGPRFGGTAGPAVSTCQDCHMPKVEGVACLSFLSPPLRGDIPQHNFSGVNSWVLRAVHHLYPPAFPGSQSPIGLTDEDVDASIARNIDMQRRAANLELTQVGSQLNVRVVNMTGHKLPTGYHEGRKMWVNVRFLDGGGNLVAERGAYDYEEAILHRDDTKVYEAHYGIDAAVSALTGIPEGPTLRFILNNKIYFDNRIPPMGFTNAAFAQVQAEPVGYVYADGQYWDDTLYTLPAGAVAAEVRLFHQTTTREYIEFLRDNNITNMTGEKAFMLWEMFGKSEPVEKALATITLSVACPADFDNNGVVNTADITAYLSAWFDARATGTTAGGSDFDGNGVVNTADITAFLSAWFAARAGGC